MSEIVNNAIRGMMRYRPAYRGTRFQSRSNVFTGHAFDRHNRAPTIKLKTRNKNRATYASSRNASFPFPLLLLPRRAAPRNSLKPVEIPQPRLCRHVTTNENNVGACIYERYRLYAPARRGAIH